MPRPGTKYCVQDGALEHQGARGGDLCHEVQRQAEVGLEVDVDIREEHRGVTRAQP
jgi:hypothetical protein